MLRHTKPVGQMFRYSYHPPDAIWQPQRVSVNLRKKPYTEQRSVGESLTPGQQELLDKQCDTPLSRYVRKEYRNSTADRKMAWNTKSEPWSGTEKFKVSR